ncbi:hypothetical protein OG555_17710 [Kribbella sp. NBC_01484]|uniref:hypothetical protein n=1 Tax=Kribbella sp. NBC_01484 TaxID=2903579 RepID=UPI002E327FE6|nr:hypothetical protein [Kribbella sp. NBC_01484]
MTIDSFTEYAHSNNFDWADPVLTPLTRSQATRLVHLGLAVATRLGLDVAYEGGAALVPVEPSAEGPVLGLSNLARTLSRYEEQRWPALVEEHFVQLLDCLRNGPPPPPEDPERELLQRLVPREALPTHWSEDRSDFVPGLMSVPATINDGTVTMYLEPPDLGLTWPEAERFGLANLRRLTDHVEYLDHDDIRIAFVTGTPFAASRALVLDTVLRDSLHLDHHPPHGLLAAVPARDLLLLHVIKDLSVIPALGLLLNLAARSHTHDPGPLSPEVHLVTPTTPSPEASPDPRHPFTWHPATTSSPDSTPLRLSPHLESLTKLLATHEPPPPPH